MAEGLIRNRRFFPKAVGGTETTITQDGKIYRVHSFTQVGTSTLQVVRGGEVEYLVVAGGGEGANAVTDQTFENGGGGGAGGFREGSADVAVQSYSVVVGAGGSTGTGGTTSPGTGPANGSPSSALGIESAGGGRGGMRDIAVQAGGSGGGNCSFNSPLGEASSTQPGAAGNIPAVSPSQGNNGGSGNGTSGGNAGAGGGGGAGGVGGNGTSTVGGNGGAGKQSSITGTNVFYSAGGGGSGSTAGSGGSGIGGNASNSGGGSPGAQNTGSGGGGAFGGTNTSGGSGGSGIVIIRYRIG